MKTKLVGLYLELDGFDAIVRL
uniref:Uncharacterized protein n=1 Tax=Arundo donax TaxID=35708 RepID=A0A0A8YET7_ARUDO